MFAPRIAALAAAAALALAAACRDAAGPVAPSAIRLDQDTIVVLQGEQGTLVAVAVDSRGRMLAGAELAFRSDDPGIATIDSLGRVTGVAVGTTRVAALSGGLRAQAVVVVEPLGGLRVKRFEFVFEYPWADWIEVDSWPEQLQELRFVAENEAGVNVCDRVRLELQVYNPQAFGAVQDPANPCIIRLEGREGHEPVPLAFLRATVDGLSDSVWVEVNRTRYRMTFTSEPYDSVQAGATVPYTLTVLGRDGPVAGMLVAFAADTINLVPVVHPPDPVDSLADVVVWGTDAAGVATFYARAPRSTLIRYNGWYRGWHYQAMRRMLRARISQLPSATRNHVRGLTLEDAHAVVPAEPVRIAIYRQRLVGDDYEWVEVTGNQVYIAPLPSIQCPYATPHWGGWAAAAAVDRFGNAVSVAPEPIAVGQQWGTLVTREAPFTVRAWGQVEDEYWHGTRLEVKPAGTLASTEVILTWPGLASRTVSVIHSPSC
ncbi:MAG TPA: Ig-like domain-containing protein [Longimicrobium sp.]|nr:Ig-like domain-containing protein [Longimicrobium sp.]